MVGYYSRFIKEFSKIVQPLTQLMKENNRFTWDENTKAAFQELKMRLTSSSVLTLSQEGETFMVYSDASKLGLGYQWLRPENMEALPLWEEFQLFFDHKSLKYIFMQKDLNMCQHWWIETLKDFHFNISYHPSKAKSAADALSWKTKH
ncbi:uncharacterized protein LOC131238910 [Magnolia sinica]|uniref:uncharacterized protein LOC131238910 n=1 Tax=Magnolia sinica TaxID=86752 RepID=UPI00265A5898|nr:uncharacterized protein LOC131238910 [Magnolia sinica]